MKWINKITVALLIVTALACKERMASADAAIFNNIEIALDEQDRKYVTGKVTRIADASH